MQRISPLFLLFLLLLAGQVWGQSRKIVDFNQGWSFRLDSVGDYHSSGAVYADWETLDLPHDWSIRMPFDSLSPAGSGGAYLSGGVGWYKKSFSLSKDELQKLLYIEFGGVYENSEMWLNDTYLGHRPNGYVPIRYDLTSAVYRDGKPNVLTVKVDNSRQPNSRFYAGSGIYRSVRLVFTDAVAVVPDGLFLSTPSVEAGKARVRAQLELKNQGRVDVSGIRVETRIFDAKGNLQAKTATQDVWLQSGAGTILEQDMEIRNPKLWAPDSPTRYRAVTTLRKGKHELDRYESYFGIRTFAFDAEKGFSLNGQAMKIRGVCLHSDLGALGMAFNRSAALRQLQLMKEMGVNGIRTSHNPAASEFLDLCDELGFIVMNETFDGWKNGKNPYDYQLYWDEWYARDFSDQIKRDRNHPSLFIWCLGNEVQEQWQDRELGLEISRKLAVLVDSLDGTRVSSIANNEMSTENLVLKSDAVDLIGYNYNHEKWISFPKDHPGRNFIVTESTSALESRGQYDLLPVDSVRSWPLRWDIPFDGGNADKSISAYDHVRTPWGSTHEASLRLLERYPHISGMYVWTGFDYLGEPTPYTFPARSSYFGIVDLAGFPKDVYYLYQSVWTDTSVLHLLPHWNWQQGDTVDVVAYYNQADEVELFLNGTSLGKRAKLDGALHVKWHVPFEAGTLEIVAYQQGKAVRRASRETTTKAVRLQVKQQGEPSTGAEDDLIFLEIVALDEAGREVPDFNEWVEVEVGKGGKLLAMDNGNPTDLTSFQSARRRAYNGKLLAIVRPEHSGKSIRVRVHGQGLVSGLLEISLK